MINNGLTRGCVVRIDDTIKDILSKRSYKKEVAKIMSEAISLAVCFTYSLKTKGMFSLRIDGEGAVKLLVAEVNEKGDIRAYANYDKDADLGDGSLLSLFKAGTISFTFEMPTKSERYQGVVELNKKTLSECAEEYFKVSEQIDTVIKIATDDECRAGAFFIQKMPSSGGNISMVEADDADDAWRNAIIMLGTLKDEELLSKEVAKQDLVYRLYHESSPVLLGKKGIKFGCRCSYEKAFSAVSSLKEEDRGDLQEFKVLCEFCGQEYVVKREDLK